MLIQSIIDIPQICSQLGIEYAIISPGSRSAHITIAFARHPQIKKIVIPDERSAAYIALGLAQSSNKAVALICTSGTATINYYPAIAEAYYQNVPILVLTADRPAKWIDKNDGQTIRQNDLYKNHIKRFYTFPESSEIGNSNHIIASAIHETFSLPQGPVHVNIPIDEPFYPVENEEMQFAKIDSLTELKTLAKDEIPEKKELETLNRKSVAIIAGQGAFNEELNNILGILATEKSIPVFADVISNVHSFDGVILNHDTFDSSFEKELVPDVIISFGRSILSKRLKQALRNNRELIHWHVSENDFPADTYLSLNKVFYNSPIKFFSHLLKQDIKPKQDYLTRLLTLKVVASKNLKNFISNIDFGEFKAFEMVLNSLPANCTIHLANSMPVRYANILTNEKGSKIFANRGTSGIDGCNSTAVGHAIHDKGQHFLLTGDMAFFYDRNAFWHNHLPNNLKIIIFNNHGGGIFRLIDGPSRQPELEEYFETRQKLTAKNTALDFGMDYYFCNNYSELQECLPAFLTDAKKMAILEIETNNKVNQKVFKKYKSIIKNEA